MKDKAHISVIPSVFKKAGVERIVISPGSRNAPLIQAFQRIMPRSAVSVVDERSAAYFALGMAVKSNNPVVVVTSSGTAVLNLGPAVAEAFHLGVPLIILTADRPPEWLDQQDNQTIRQRNSFAINCKSSYELPVASYAEEDLWHTDRIVNEAFNKAVSGKPGPVHINVPLREPLYGELPLHGDARRIEHFGSEGFELNEELRKIWSRSERILVLCGQCSPNRELQKTMERLSLDNRVAVFSESLSNIKGDGIIENPDLIFLSHHRETAMLSPDLIIYFGGQIVSKRLKNYLRKSKPVASWYISPGFDIVDTFTNLTAHIQSEALPFFQTLAGFSNNSVKRDYGEKWLKLQASIRNRVEKATDGKIFSDLMIIKNLTEKISQEDILFAGNSSAIRYIQTFPVRAKKVFSNRGTSGIDGCVSTASGIAAVSRENVIAVLGDLTFVYDSNGLWNRKLPENLKIVVVNNKGGGIFNLIDGPSSQDGFEEFFEAYHPVDIKKLAGAFHVPHYEFSGEGDFDEIYNDFYKSTGAAILEIKTETEINTSEYKSFMERMTSNE